MGDKTNEQNSNIGVNTWITQNEEPYKIVILSEISLNYYAVLLLIEFGFQVKRRVLLFFSVIRFVVFEARRLTGNTEHQRH